MDLRDRYIGLFVLQLLPSLLIGYKFASFAYFGLLAVSTVYLGAKRQDIPDVSIQNSGTLEAALRLLHPVGYLLIVVKF